MVIDQRNAGAASANTINGYFLDRWNISQSTLGKLIAQQNAGTVTPPAGFSNYLGVTSQSAYSVTSTDFFILFQRIEGFNVSDFAWGTASAVPVTVSFWVRSSLTGSFGGSLRNGAGTRSYPFAFTISSANTWEQKTVTIAGDTSGTWETNNTAGLILTFSIGSGSTRLGTANAWATANYDAPTGSTSVVGTSGATFYITGVQLEKGSTATSFDYRPYGTELALCQRYFEKSFNIETAPVQNAGVGTGESMFPQPVAASTGTMALFTSFKVAKRSSTTVTIFNPAAANAQIRNETTNADWTGSAAENLNQSGFAITGTTPAGTGVGQKNGFHWTASAEL
jgi:hypothetical protein